MFLVDDVKSKLLAWRGFRWLISAGPPHSCIALM